MCLSGVGTYLPGTALQGSSLFKQCWNLPAGHCVAEVQAVLSVSEATCWALCCRGACCLIRVGTYLPGTVSQVCKLFKQCQFLPTEQVSWSELYGYCSTFILGLIM